MNKDTKFEFTQNGEDFMIIEPNEHKEWLKCDEDKNLIFITDKDGDYISLNLNEADFLIKSFSKIIDYYKTLPEENILNKSDKVKIIAGRFKDCEGVIIDIDKCDFERPVVIKISSCEEFGNVTVFLDYKDVEKI